MQREMTVVALTGQRRRQGPRHADARPTSTSACRTNAPRASRKSTCWCCTACATGRPATAGEQETSHEVTNSIAPAPLRCPALSRRRAGGLAHGLRRRWWSAVPSSAAPWSRPTAAPRARSSRTRPSSSRRRAASATRSATAARQRHQLQPPGAADRRRARPTPTRPRAERDRRAASTTCEAVVNELVVGPAQPLHQRSNDALHHQQGQGQPARRQGPLRQLDQGRHRARRVYLMGRVTEREAHRAAESRAASTACARWCAWSRSSPRPSWPRPRSRAARQRAPPAPQ